MKIISLSNAKKLPMNDIYDDIYSISCVEDIQDMLGRIQLVCQKGMPLVSSTMKSIEISMALPCSLTELSIWILKGLRGYPLIAN